MKTKKQIEEKRREWLKEMETRMKEGDPARLSFANGVVFTLNWILEKPMTLKLRG